MPTYEYRCLECGYEFEAFQTISEAPVSTCPTCSGKVERKISGGAGFLFKGSGFYITDHRSQQYKADAAKDKTDRPIARTESRSASSSSSADSSKKAD